MRLSGGERKDIACQGCFHRGHGGARARRVRARKRAIETKERQAGRDECASRLADHRSTKS